MSVNDHDELLTRADYAHVPREIWNALPEAAQDRLAELIDVIAELAAALRAALAARPQPLFEGTGIELDEWMADQATSDLVSMRAVVYAEAVAGSATPTGCTYEHHWDAIYSAVACPGCQAGAATPTCRRCGIALPDGGEYATDTEDGMVYHYCPDSDACDAREAAGSATPTEENEDGYTDA